MPADCGPSPSARSMLPEQPGAACAVGGAGGPLYPPQLGFDRRTVVIGLRARCQGGVAPRGAPEAVPIRPLRGLPRPHGGLGAPGRGERCGRWSQPALSRSPLVPLRHTPGQRVGPCATVSLAQDGIPRPPSPVAVPGCAKAAVQPEPGPAPRRWRQPSHPRQRRDRGGPPGRAGLGAGLDQGHQVRLVLRGTPPGELTPATVVFPLQEPWGLASAGRPAGTPVRSMSTNNHAWAQG